MSLCQQCSRPVPKNWLANNFARIAVCEVGREKTVTFTCPECIEKNCKAAEARQAGEAWKDANTLPDADTTVLVYHKLWDEPLWLGYFDGEHWCWVEGHRCTPAPTHWMDFPEPPEAA